MTIPFIIAIDGPAASGKGTLARKLSAELGLPHLDTGLTYRAVGAYLLDQGLSLDDEALAVQAARQVDLGALDQAVLSQHHIGEAASKIAAFPAVRVALVEQQREFANRGVGAVLDGRDIGTVVCPNAQVKLYVIASVNERARRRWNEVQLKGQDTSFETILEDIRKRDERDMGRDDSPLRPAEDAHLLDTSKMDIETAFQFALGFVRKALAD